MVREFISINKARPANLVSRFYRRLSVLRQVLLVKAALLMAGSSLAFPAAAAQAVFQIQQAPGTFIEIPLQPDIYQFSQDANLTDLQILDANQNPLPWRLVAPEVLPVQAAPEIRTKALQFFPIAADAKAADLQKLYNTQISLEGEQLHITRQAANTPTQAAPEFYLIDARQLQQAITHLVVDWQANKDTQYLQVSLEGSENLQDWQIIEDATLVQINQQDQSLKHNRIETQLPEDRFEFLRLKVLRGGDKIQINQITAEEETISDFVPAPTKQSWRVSGEKAQTQTSASSTSSHSAPLAVNAWEYARAEITPAQEIALDLGEQPYGDTLHLYSRNNPQKPWQLQFAGIWYQTQVGALWQKSAPIKLGRNSHRYWRVELAAGASPLLNPQLEFAWQADALRIIANQHLPFNLVFNRSEDKTHAAAQVFNQIISNQTPNWQLAQLTPLNVDAAQFAAAPSALDGKKILFWGSLLIAVVVLLIFSLRLFKQLKQEAQREHP